MDRLRATRLCVVACESRLLQTSCTSKAALLLDSLLSWGPSHPDWQESFDALATRCSCPLAGALMLVSCCWTCGGAAFPAHVGDPLPCRWCHSRGLIACPSCNHTLHYRDVGPGTSNLCPDCWQHWARSVAGCPRHRRAPLQNDLLAHLLQAAEECQAGAGQSAALAASPSTPSQACASVALGLHPPTQRSPAASAGSRTGP